MFQFTKSLISNSLEARVKRLKYDLTYFGFKEYCPACQRRSSSFKPFDLSLYHVEGGIIPPIIVPNTVCPWCNSHIHHRLMWRVLPQVIDEVGRKQGTHRRILHFAPEKFSESRLRNLAGFDYITTDLVRNDVDVQSDMCQLSMSNESVDLIIASHVLEHVPNDLDALKEIYRILRFGGIVILTVPLLAKHSFEVEGVKTAEDRIRHYGQVDHVRAYGLDFASQISNAGFTVEIIRARDFPEIFSHNYLLDIQGVLFLGKKL